MDKKKYIETNSYNIKKGTVFKIKLFEEVTTDKEVNRIKEIGRMQVTVRRLKEGKNWILSTHGRTCQVISHPFVLEKPTVYMDIGHMNFQYELFKEALKIARENRCEAIMTSIEGISPNLNWFTEKGFKQRYTKEGYCYFIVKEL